MLKSKIIIALFGLSAFALVGCAQLVPAPEDSSNQMDSQATSQVKAEVSVMEPEPTQVEANVTVEPEVSDATSQPPIQVANAMPLYEPFSEPRYEQLSGSQTFALFFHAPWCPTCRQMEQDILTGLADFPEGTVILKADYDTETELKEKYGINSQSIIVVIDENGDAVDTLVAPSNDKLIETINKAL